MLDADDVREVRRYQGACSDCGEVTVLCDSRQDATAELADHRRYRCGQ